MSSSFTTCDVFICHAIEDRDEVARPLAEALRSHGLNVSYDEVSLNAGDSLDRKIDYAFANSNYGIIIFSKNFLEKRWLKTEFHSLIDKHLKMNKKIILPILHKISRYELKKYSATLADLDALETSEGITNIAEELIREIRSVRLVFDLDNRLRDSNFSSRMKMFQEQIHTEEAMRAKTVDSVIEAVGASSITDEELSKGLDRIINNNMTIIQEKGINSLSTLMGRAMAEYRGKANGQKVNAMLEDKISKMVNK
jgi:Glu-tRNA(Gln) amidotransferase subunit E-like FAD-binding protein